MSSIPPIPPPSGANPLRRSNSTPHLNTTTATDSLEQAAKPDSVSINGKANPAANTAENSAKASKPFYQPIIDFIQNMGRKIMDIFTPTSQEAIEKALTKSQLKSESYLTRIARNEQYLAIEGLSDLQKEVLTKDSQKAEKKLEKLVAQSNKLNAKFEKLTGVSAKPPEAKAEAKAATNEAVATADEAVETAAKASAKGTPQSTAEGAEKVAKEAAEASTKGTQQSTAEGAEKVAKEAAEAVEGVDADKAIQELIESFTKHVEDFAGKAKESFPGLIDSVAALLKKAA